MWLAWLLLAMLTACNSFPRHFYRAWPHKGLGAGTRRLASAVRSGRQQEVAVFSEKDACVQEFLQLRPHAVPICQPNGDATLRWHLLRDGLQVDSATLEHIFSGQHALPASETGAAWNRAVESRLGSSVFQLGIGGPLEQELGVAVAAVQSASYFSRAFQRAFRQQADASSAKEDNSPVTVADYAVQALILERLHKAFPSDSFVAEEDSSLLLAQPALAQQVVDLLSAVTADQWTLSRLLSAVDLGGCERTHHGRVWVLDPIDGTKGFIRSQHYCVALGLLIDGQARLSVLGCPNLHLRKALQGSHNVAEIPPDDVIALGGESGGESASACLPSAEAGAVFFATSNHGAYVRAMDMPLTSAFEVLTNAYRDVAQARICESYEANHSNRRLTRSVAASLGINSDFVHVDGMVKQALVGCGAAEATLRLPPEWYREKIWDHVAGSHFVQEAGGVVSDLSGRPLDFSQGRMLSPSVQGVVSAHCPRTHRALLDTIGWARQENPLFDG